MLFSGRCAFPLCNKRGSDVAHIVGKGQNTHWRWEEWNGLLLCRDHHDAFDGRSGIAAMEIARDALKNRFPVLFKMADEHRHKTAIWTLSELEEKLQHLKESLCIFSNIF